MPSKKFNEISTEFGLIETIVDSFQHSIKNTI